MNYTTLITAIKNEVKANGGLTICNTTVEELLDGNNDSSYLDSRKNQWKTGYTVGNNKYSVLVMNFSDYKETTANLTIVGALVELEQKLIDSGKDFNGVGFWLDSTTDTLYIEPVIRIEVLATALNTAASTKELAIWDNVCLREISTATAA